MRTVEGPGNQVGGANSGYQSLRDGRSSSRGGGYGEIESVSGADSEMDLLAAHRRALATAFPGRARAGRQRARPRAGAARAAPRRARVNAAADQQLMTLLRRLTAIASQPGELDPARMPGRRSARRATRSLLRGRRATPSARHAGRRA